jgi:hypothetical protein
VYRRGRAFFQLTGGLALESYKRDDNVTLGLFAAIFQIGVGMEL